MKIETKFDLGQEVWINIPYLNSWGGVPRVLNRAEKFTITGIQARVSKFCGCEVDTIYFFENLGEQNEMFLFATKEEAEAKIRIVKGEE